MNLYQAHIVRCIKRQQLIDAYIQQTAVLIVAKKQQEQQQK